MATELISDAALELIAKLPDDYKELNPDHLVALRDLRSRIIAVGKTNSDQCEKRTEETIELVERRGGDGELGAFHYMTKAERKQYLKRSHESEREWLDLEQAHEAILAWQRRCGPQEVFERSGLSLAADDDLLIWVLEEKD